MPARVATSAAKPGRRISSSSLMFAGPPGRRGSPWATRSTSSTELDVARSIAENAAQVSHRGRRRGAVRDAASLLNGPASPAALGSAGSAAPEKMPHGSAWRSRVAAAGVDVSYLGVAGTGLRQGSGTRYAVALGRQVQAALVPSGPSASTRSRSRTASRPNRGRCSPSVLILTFGYGMTTSVVGDGHPGGPGWRPAGRRPPTNLRLRRWSRGVDRRHGARWSSAP